MQWAYLYDAIIAHKDSCIFIYTSRGIHGNGCFFRVSLDAYTRRACRQILASNSVAKNRPKKHFVLVKTVFWQRRYQISSYCSVVREL